MPRSSLSLFVVVLVLGILPAHALEWPALDGVGLVGHVLSAAGFMCVAIIVHQIATNAATRIVHLALLAAVTALLVHGQIEMTFIQPGAMVWSMCALGALGLPLTSAFATPVTGRAILPLMWIAAIALVAAVLVFAAIIPAFGQQSSMLQAAAMLESIRQDPANHELMLRQRRAAAAELVQAYDRWPANVHPLNAAAMQLRLASSQPRGPRPMGLLLDASAIIQRAIDAHDTNSSLVIAIEIHVQLAALTADAEHWNRAVAFSRELTRRDPHGISSWRRLGDVLWAAGERVAAADAYRRALQNDANFELDELKRLTPAQRENISNRIKEAESS